MACALEFSSSEFTPAVQGNGTVNDVKTGEIVNNKRVLIVHNYNCEQYAKLMYVIGNHIHKLRLLFAIIIVNNKDQLIVHNYNCEQ